VVKVNEVADIAHQLVEDAFDVLQVGGVARKPHEIHAAGLHKCIACRIVDAGFVIQDDACVWLKLPRQSGHVRVHMVSKTV